MATFDDPQWILTLIQNAYITTDDTGLCENVIQGNEGRKQVAEFPFFVNSDNLLDIMEPEPSSPDITSDFNLSSQRLRSYMEKGSELLKKERDKTSRAKQISWKQNIESEPTDVNFSELFKKKVILSEPEEDAAINSSLLSFLIENSSESPGNLFNEYSKFDGDTHNSVARKKLNIYLYIGKNPCLDYPMPVNVINSAKVSQVIGLICWLYTKQNRQPPLKTIDHYQLHIAEEDGQCFWDFQPLERRDIIDKYGFNTLALVERNRLESNIVVTVNFARGEFSKIKVENKDVTLKEILAKSISRRKEIAKMKEVGVNYHLEKEDELGIILNMEQTFAEVDCYEFAAVRDNSKRTNGNDYRSPNRSDQSIYSFIALWEKKFSKYDTAIEITRDQIEITPLPTKGKGKVIPIKYRIDQMIACTKKQIKKSKWEVMITIQGEHRFKDYKFICDSTVAHQLFEKCDHYIKVTNKERKPLYFRHNSFSLKKKVKPPISQI